MSDLPRDFGPYRLLSRLGAGGMGEVLLAESEPIAGVRRRVAIKRLLADTRNVAFTNMLLDEARIWLKLQHPNIVAVLDFGEVKGDWFLALELVDGCTASALVAATGPLPPKEALCIVERVARALDYAHGRTDDSGAPLHIVHRDVKPANILLSKRGDVKLTDFGIARALGRLTRTQTGVVKGSLPFISPEQARGDEVDGRSDVFALGCTLHGLLTGTHLIPGGQMAVLSALANGKIPPPPEDLPASIRSLLSSLTAAEPADRPATALEAAKQIRGMMLPEHPEDIEPMLGALVRHVVEPDSARPPKPPPAPTTAPRIANLVALAPPTGMDTGAAAPRPSPPAMAPAPTPSATSTPGAEPLFKSPLHLFAVVTMGLIVVWVGVAILFHTPDPPRRVPPTPSPIATARLPRPTSAPGKANTPR